MPRRLTKEETANGKSDKELRNRIKAELIELVEIGKPRIHSVDSPETRSQMSYRVATEDTIIRFCDDLGNYNPLYRSYDNTKSIYGSLIAPPHFLTAISCFAGLPYNELQKSTYLFETIEAGISVEWFKIIRENDEFTVVEIPTEVRDIIREDTDIRFLLTAKKIYRNQRDEVVAVVDTSLMMISIVEHGKTQQQLIRKRPPKVRHFSEQEVEDWYQLMLKEQVRGATPRFWEDVNIGDQLPPYHQAFSTMEHIYLMRGGGYPGSGCWRLQMARSNERHSGWRTVLDPESGLPDFTNYHMLDNAAQGFGLPRSVAAGAQMTCWLCNLVTNWMGDTGLLVKIKHQYRRPLWRDSLVLCKGQVINKYIKDDKHLVDVRMTLEDHNGDLQIPDSIATVVLPASQLNALK